MLVISRFVGERIFIREDIIITVIDTRCGKVKLGIDAPAEVVVLREELRRRKKEKDEKKNE